MIGEAGAGPKTLITDTTRKRNCFSEPKVLVHVRRAWEHGATCATRAPSSHPPLLVPLLCARSHSHPDPTLAIFSGNHPLGVPIWSSRGYISKLLAETHRKANCKSHGPRTQRTPL